MVGSRVPDISQTIGWPDTALPAIGMVHHKRIALSPSGSYVFSAEGKVWKGMR